MDDKDLSITLDNFDDTISIDTTNMASSFFNTPSYYSIGSTGATGSAYNNITINTSAGSNGSWSTTAPYITGSGKAGLHVSTDAVFDGDVKIQGVSITGTLKKIEDRLAILQDPDPAKLEKFAALKKAYEHYKMLERLIGDDSGPTESS